LSQSLARAGVAPVALPTVTRDVLPTRTICPQHRPAALRAELH
jgi:hypothetical protein